MTKKLTVFVIVGMMLITMNLAADPRGGNRDMMRHARFGIHMAENFLFPGRILLKFKDEINLTPKQVQVIEKMDENYKEAGIRKQADIKILELKLHSYLKKDPVDRKQMEKMIREVAQMRTDMQIDRMNYLLDVKKILTKEQLEKIESLKKRRRQRALEERRRKYKHDRKRSPRFPLDTESDEVKKK